MRFRTAFTIHASLVLLCLSGCSESGKSPTPEYYDDGTGIQWLRGDVEGAFALAAEQNKPVFLYWGTEW